MRYRIMFPKIFVQAVLLLGIWMLGSAQWSATGDEDPVNKLELGQRLFFDPILSQDSSVSCASCHKPEFAFADSAQFSLGVGGFFTERNTPSVMNSAGRLQFFWDGRAASLEDQALQPIAAVTEMNLPIEAAIKRLNTNKKYRRWFQQIFKAEASPGNLASALAAFEKSLETANTPYDRYVNGDDAAMNAAQIRGRLLFIGKANCANCHSGEDFTADRFKNIGLFNGADLNDPGRFRVTKDSAQLGHFKIPSLRNIAQTAPYMHNGMFRTLREVIDYYNRPDHFVRNGMNRDKTLDQPLNLSETEIADLEAFLHALSDDRFKSH
jgi:cytochrome c peroxidase